MLGETFTTIRLEINNQCFLLEKGKYYLIGKDCSEVSSSNYIQLAECVDEKHCLLEVDSNEEIFVIDLESVAGIYVNNKRIEPLTKECVRPDGGFRLGEHLKVNLKLLRGKESNIKEKSGPIKGKKQIRNFIRNNDTEVDQMHNADSSDSFRIPETEFYQSELRSSTTNAANYTNGRLNRMSCSGDKQEGVIFVTETQEGKATDTDLNDDDFVRRPNSVADSVDVGEVTGSQFRISTEEFNDSSKMEGSQIIPILNHNVVLISESDGRTQNREFSGTFGDETAIPDMFDFLEEDSQINSDNDNKPVDNEEDLVPTKNNKSEIQILGMGKTRVNDSLLTLSDKENTHPANETQFKSICMITNVTNMQDNADSLLTEEFFGTPISKSTATKVCLNSTFLTDTSTPKSPSKFFKDVEIKTPQSSNLVTFKKPMTEDTSARSNTSESSTVDSDVELLMCTPRLIKEHINISGLQLSMAKNINISDSNSQSEGNEENDVIRLINKKSKENKDFELLLPHIKSPSRPFKKSHLYLKENGFKILDQDSMQNNTKDNRKGKKGSGNKRIIAEDEKKFHNGKSGKQLEKITAKISANGSSASVTNNAMQEDQKRRLKRASIRDRELQNAAKRGASISYSPTELPKRPLTRSRTKEQLRSENDGNLDLIPTQSLVRAIETQSYDPSSEESGTKNELKRKCVDVRSSKESSKRSRRTSAAQVSTSASFKRCLQVSTTMVDNDVLEELIRNSRDLWTVTNDPLNSELLIMDKGNRTYKFLLAMAKGIPIVTTEWIKKVNESHSLIPFTDYFFSDPVFEKKYKFSILKSVGLAKKKSLFQGYRFLATSNISPPPTEIKNIIECAGGQLHNEYDKINAKKEQGKIYLISCLDDKKHWRAFRRRYKNIIIVSSEAIMLAIMCQDIVQLDKFAFT
uniref:Mediator of DNA damage checkpoint protein 1 n=1 Tax=Glossina brevipalpis TaxID=37001 RepID=A0A1A9W058_9MUSC